MAIVENRSSDIGDILRISTNVPIVGVVSLYSFLDNTEGESQGGGTGVIPPLEDSRKVNNNIYKTYTLGSVVYAISYGNDGSNEIKTIASYDRVLQAWDTDYPDAPEILNGIVESGGYIYANSLRFVGNTRYVSVRRMSISTKIWEDILIDGLTNSDTNSSLGLGSSASNIIDGKVPVILGSTLSFFNLSSHLWETSSIYVSGAKYGIGVDPVDEKLYFLPSYLTGARYLNVYNYQTDSLESNTPTLPPAADRLSNDITYADGAIYITYRDDSSSSGFDDLLAKYTVTSGSWNLITRNDIDYPPSKSASSLSSDGGNIIWSDKSIYVFNTTTGGFEGDTVLSKYFTKVFRYSVDGGNNFTQWVELSGISIQNVEISRKDLFVVEYRYERSGDDPAGELTWNSTSLSGEIDPLPYPVYDKSLFKKFFDVNDANVLGWALNVLEKLYQRGVVPDYIERNFDEYNPIETDKDYLTFFNSITHFFAIIVYYARQFRDLSGNAYLTREFILSRGLVPPFNENLEDMIYILDNYVDEYKKRGTEEIFKGVEDGRDIDGELLRLLNYKLDDEFLFGLMESKDVGWCIGESSPTWSHTKRVKNLIKGYEFTQEVEDLNKYPLVNDSFIDIFEDASISKDVMRVLGHQGSAGGVAGIGFVDSDSLIKIDPSLDYEVSFKIKKTTSDPVELVFDLLGYDSNKSFLSLKNSEDGSNSSSFVSSSINLKIDNTYYSFRGVLFNKDKPNSVAIKPLFENGNYLRSISGTKFIQPVIGVTTTLGTSNVYIYDIKILPLNLPFTQGQLGVKNVITAYMKNSGGFNNSEVSDFTKRYLISYKNYLKTKFI